MNRFEPRVDVGDVFVFVDIFAAGSATETGEDDRDAFGKEVLKEFEDGVDFLGVLGNAEDTTTIDLLLAGEGGEIVFAEHVGDFAVDEGGGAIGEGDGHGGVARGKLTGGISPEGFLFDVGIVEGFCGEVEGLAECVVVPIGRGTVFGEFAIEAVIDGQEFAGENHGGVFDEGGAMLGFGLGVV